MAATGPDQVKSLATMRSPLPCANTISLFWQSRCPILLIGCSNRSPGAPRGTSMPLNPCLPPLDGAVRTMTTLTSAPFRSHPPELHGQYLRPLRTYSPLPLSSSAVTPTPAGWALGWSKFAVPPGVPAGSLTVQPAKYSRFLSLVAAPIHLRFCSSLPYQATGMRPKPLTSRIVAKHGSTAVFSSATICRSTLLTLPPPYSLGRNPMAKPPGDLVLHDALVHSFHLDADL